MRILRNLAPEGPSDGITPLCSRGGDHREDVRQNDPALHHANMYPTSHPLDEDAWSQAARTGLRAADGCGNGPYGAWNAGRQVTGRLGEIACLRWINKHSWLAAQGLIAAAGFAESGADVLVSGHGVEVKTFRRRWWQQYGPCVSANQLEAIVRNSTVISFWTLPDLPADASPDRPSHVTCRGWVFTVEIEEFGEPEIDAAWRARLKIPADRLRPAVELLDRILTGRLAPPRLQPERALLSDSCGSCGAALYCGHCWRCCARPDGLPEQVWITEQGRAWHPGRGFDPVRRRHDGLGFFRRVAIDQVVAARRPCPICVDAEHASSPAG
jgi:hypothetical protein